MDFGFGLWVCLWTGIVYNLFVYVGIDVLMLGVVCWGFAVV